MTSKKEYLSYFIYMLSMLLFIGEGLDLLLFFKKFVLAGKGIGIYGVIIYHAAAFVSFILWGISYYLVPNKKLAIIFWAIFLVFTIFISSQPTWWAAPLITS